MEGEAEEDGLGVRRHGKGKAPEGHAVATSQRFAQQAYSRLIKPGYKYPNLTNMSAAYHILHRSESSQVLDSLEGMTLGFVAGYEACLKTRA